MTKVIGFVGAGQLGEPMVARLVAAGHDVLVYARRPEVRESVASTGAAVADSVADLARQADILISCLFSDAQLTEAGLGPDGLIANAKPGSVFVSHTTGTLTTLTALRDSHSSPPVILDAPVSGTVESIVAGTLTVLLGGPSDAVQMVTPVTTPERLSQVIRASTGFVYAVTMTGTTGALKGMAAEVSSDVIEYMDRVRACSNVPVCAGFGIRSREQVVSFAGHVDGVVVGSALVEILERREDVRAFLRSLRLPSA